MGLWSKVPHLVLGGFVATAASGIAILLVKKSQPDVTFSSEDPQTTPDNFLNRTDFCEQMARIIRENKSFTPEELEKEWKDEWLINIGKTSNQESYKSDENNNRLTWDTVTRKWRIVLDEIKSFNFDYMGKLSGKLVSSCLSGSWLDVSTHEMKIPKE